MPRAFSRPPNKGPRTFRFRVGSPDSPASSYPPETQLRGAAGAELHLKAGQPGLLLSADHPVADLRVVTDETQIALGLSDDAEDLGTLDIQNVRTVGRFHLEGTQAHSGHLKLRQIHVERADARLAAHRPAGCGVEAWTTRRACPVTSEGVCMVAR